MIKRFLHKSVIDVIVIVFVIVNAVSCIEPPIHWPEGEPQTDVEVEIQLELNTEIQWNINTEWKKHWFYGWDSTDSLLWGKIEYPIPTSFEARRYFLGDTPGAKHGQVEPFQVYENPFKRKYKFGYYDLLLWSEIDSPTDKQNVTIDESNMQEITASSTFKKGMKKVETAYDVVPGIRLLTASADKDTKATLLFDQPEIFYSAYPQNIHISNDMSDYEWNEATHTYIKKIKCMLQPLVYTYLVQVIFKNNGDGRIAGTSGDNAMSNISSGTSVNFGKTWDAPSVVYYEGRMKKDILFNHEDTLGIKKGEHVDIIGGKLTTYGLCAMDQQSRALPDNYTGSRKDLKNCVYVDLTFKNGAKATLEADVTDQVRYMPYGGVITIVLDSGSIPTPDKPDPDNPDNPDEPHDGPGSLFIPTVEDYDEIVYEIIM